MLGFLLGQHFFVKMPEPFHTCYKPPYHRSRCTRCLYDYGM